jgi:hypothetical protein
MLLAAGAAIAVAAVAARYVVGAIDTRQKMDALTNPDAGTDETAKPKAAPTAAKPATAPNTGGYWSAQSMARRFYRGGFEDTMILGVR